MAIDDEDWQVYEIAAQLVDYHERHNVEKLVELLIEDVFSHMRIAAKGDQQSN